MNYFKPFDISDKIQCDLLQFVDEIILVAKLDWENFLTIKAVLHGFEISSGLSVNFHKSRIFGINVKHDFLMATSNYLSCAITQIPFSFLGIMIGCNPQRWSTWEPALLKLQSVLTLWRGKGISLGGKVILINSILNSIPLFSFSLYKAPLAVHIDIIKIQHALLWNGIENQRKIYWVAWSTIYRSKVEGGIRIKDCKLFNRALLSK